MIEKSPRSHQIVSEYSIYEETYEDYVSEVTGGIGYIALEVYGRNLLPIKLSMEKTSDEMRFKPELDVEIRLNEAIERIKEEFSDVFTGKKLSYTTGKDRPIINFYKFQASKGDYLAITQEYKSPKDFLERRKVLELTSNYSYPIGTLAPHSGPRIALLDNTIMGNYSSPNDVRYFANEEALQKSDKFIREVKDYLSNPESQVLSEL